jgi:hypothetical protein
VERASSAAKTKPGMKINGHEYSQRSNYLKVKCVHMGVTVARTHILRTSCPRLSYTAQHAALIRTRATDDASMFTYSSRSIPPPPSFPFGQYHPSVGPAHFSKDGHFPFFSFHRLRLISVPFSGQQPDEHPMQTKAAAAARH